MHELLARHHAPVVSGQTYVHKRVRLTRVWFSPLVVVHINPWDQPDDEKRNKHVSFNSIYVSTMQPNHIHTGYASRKDSCGLPLGACCSLDTLFIGNTAYAVVLGTSFPSTGLLLLGALGLFFCMYQIAAPVAPTTATQPTTIATITAADMSSPEGGGGEGGGGCCPTPGGVEGGGGCDGGGLLGGNGGKGGSEGDTEMVVGTSTKVTGTPSNVEAALGSVNVLLIDAASVSASA